MDALRPLWDAERPEMHSHAERGNDQGEGVMSYWVTGVISRIGLPLTGAPLAT